MNMKPYRPKPLSEELKSKARVSSLEYLPGTYPFFTRHAATSGIVPLDFDTTLDDVTDGVDVDISEFRYNFERTPLMLSWYRFAASDLSYDPRSEIYKFPMVRVDDSGTELEQYSTFISSQRKLLRFEREALSAYGSAGTTRIYIKFFLFNDEVFKNVIDRSEYTTT